MGVTEFLRTLAPDFMWCSREDLFLMYEQINEDADYFCFRTILATEVKKSRFITKADDTHKRIGRLQRRLYLRAALKEK